MLEILRVPFAAWLRFRGRQGDDGRVV